MKFAKWSGGIALLTVVGVLLSSTGCTTKTPEGGKPQANKPKKDDGKLDISKEDAAHGWWCAEHGVVEEDCSLCLSAGEVKKRFKDTGDWCKLHDRAQSQCFLCEPSLYEKVWEPKYVAKYGKKPERPPESEFKKKG